MNKKKIVAVALCVAMAATAVVGGTLAYFTDVADDVENNFTIGNVQIKLEEATGIFDEKGGEQVKQVADGQYNAVMPTQYLEKTAVIKNTGDNEAFVRVFITMNNYEAINNALDEVYEDQGEDAIQGVYNDVFDGFNIMHSKDGTGVLVKDALRGWMDKTIGEVTKGVELLAIDYVRCCYENANYQYAGNTFRNECENEENSNDLPADKGTGYYADALDKDSRTYILYFKMDGHTSYTLFNGLNVPADFTAEQMEMFDGLKIGIYADAIQTTGFYDTVIKDADGNLTADYTPDFVNAITALEEAHHMGWWNNTNEE